VPTGGNWAIWFAVAAGTPCPVRPELSVDGSEFGEPGHHQREEDADGEHHAGVLEGGPHAEAAPRMLAGTLDMISDGVRRREQTAAAAVDEDQDRRTSL
jgi:hypothetical protein